MSRPTRIAVASLMAAIILSGALMAQTPLRSRYFTSLTNDEIADYLKSNDIIFLPIGPLEMWGALPVDAEYVRPLAFALKMAEEVNY